MLFKLYFIISCLYVSRLNKNSIKYQLFIYVFIYVIIKNK